MEERKDPAMRNKRSFSVEFKRQVDKACLDTDIGDIRKPYLV